MPLLPQDDDPRIVIITPDPVGVALLLVLTTVCLCGALWWVLGS